MTRASLIASKDKRLLAGLSSGTSADGVDGVLVEVTGRGEKPRLRILNHRVHPYPQHARSQIIQLSEGRGSVEDVSRLNYLLGRIFSEACLFLIEDSQVDLNELDAVGSHGQTVCHLPPSTTSATDAVPCTLQLGEPAVIAETTHTPVVFDFRAADIAAGGEGAPLAPCLDHILFTSDSKARGLLNVGGIANLTALPANSRWDQVIGFDTGPGNMVIDFMVRELYGAERDEDGRFSSEGTPSLKLMNAMLEHDFFARRPPKSAGREIFGSSYAARLLSLARRHDLPREDIVATAVMLTARATHRAYMEFVEEACPIEELYVSGGGVLNSTLMARLREAFSPAQVYTTEKLGIPPSAKEALLFAVLADRALAGVPSSLPQVTGATHRVVLGKITA